MQVGTLYTLPSGVKSLVSHGTFLRYCLWQFRFQRIPTRRVSTHSVRLSETIYHPSAGDGYYKRLKSSTLHHGSHISSEQYEMGCLGFKSLVNHTRRSSTEKVRLQRRRGSEVKVLSSPLY